jgi:hypothetical protein
MGGGGWKSPGGFVVTILAIDPGSESSGWIVYNEITNGIRAFAKLPNDELLRVLRNGVSAEVDVVVIEWTAPRGMPASAQLFETLWWAGRFAEAVDSPRSHVRRPVERLERVAVKKHLTGKNNANDTNIRAALIDRFGGIGGKAAAIGLKASPGPLYGITTDVWAALGVAVTWSDGIR